MALRMVSLRWRSTRQEQGRQEKHKAIGGRRAERELKRSEEGGKESDGTYLRGRNEKREEAYRDVMKNRGPGRKTWTSKVAGFDCFQCLGATLHYEVSM